MKKKLIAYLVSSALFFTTAFCGMTAPVHATESDAADMPQITEDDTTFIRDPETGHIGVDEEYIPYDPSDNDSSKIKPNSTIPGSYGGFSTIKNTYPNTRNQNPYGTCWAFAATACAEFDLVKNHGYSKSSADFSELQLAYVNYADPYKLGGLDDDNVWIPSSASKNYLTMGGNFFYSMHTLAQWKAYTYESQLPYTNAVNNKNYIPSKYICTYHNAAQLRNVRYLDIKNDPDSVKEAIMKYGAVYISYHHDSDYYSLNGYSLYFNPCSDATNHDVVIVGWDDNIPSSKWPAGMRPSSNGGWLVRNSWTTDQSVGSEYSYFYMSYDDNSLANTAYALDFEPGSYNDNLYQHDGSTTHSYVYTTSVANVFTSTSNGYSTQKLESVMIPFTADTNVNYKVEVYTGLTSSDPRSGYLNSSATTTGWTSSRGIYTIDLNSPVYLYPGEKFSIVVTALNGNTNFDIESSSSVTYIENGYTYPWFSTTATADAGESYVYNSGTYQDVLNYNDVMTQLTSSQTGNVCLKAITSNNDAKKYKVTYNLNGGTNSIYNPSGFLSSSSGTYTLYNPTRSGYHFCGWYTDASCTQKATYINYNNKANQTFYAKWCSNSNTAVTKIAKYANCDTSGICQTVCSGCGMVKSSYAIPAIHSIKLDYTKMVYTGSNRNPVPVITATDGTQLVNGTDYTYSYSKSSRAGVGRYYVTITFMGKYNEASKTLYYSVTPKAPTSCSAKLYGYNDIKVSWKKSTGAKGYYVYYKKASASTYSKYKLTTGTSVKFANLAGNTKYNFKIIPYFTSNGTKYKSNKYKVVSATTLKKLNQPSITKEGSNRVSLKWQCISGASGYQVYWSAKKKGTYKKLCDYSNDYIGVSFSVGKNTTYWYKTRAYKKVNGKKIFGPWSNPKSYTLR